MSKHTGRRLASATGVPLTLCNSSACRSLSSRNASVMALSLRSICARCASIVSSVSGSSNSSVTLSGSRTSIRCCA